MITLAGTAGDRRAVDNARADVRRMLRADGLLTVTPERKPEREPSRLDLLERRLQRLEQSLAGLQSSAGLQADIALKMVAGAHD